MKNLYTKQYLKIINSKEVKKEEKIFCVLELLSSQEISVIKACELFKEWGVLSETHFGLDTMVTSLYSNWTDINSNKFKE